MGEADSGESKDSVDGAQPQAQPRFQTFQALPGPAVDGGADFHQCLAELISVIGIDVPQSDSPRHWESAVRTAVGKAVRRRSGRRSHLPDAWFDALIKAAVYDPNPSFNRYLIEPALEAFGRRRVLAALLDYLLTGTDQERAGSARAWYWTGLPRQAERAVVEETRDIVAAWAVAALREFVRNEDLDVRRCLIPMFSLNPEVWPPHLRDLVGEAVAIARSYPDDYIRHRVEIQVQG